MGVDASENGGYLQMAISEGNWSWTNASPGLNMTYKDEVDEWEDEHGPN